ncbi:MAG: SDR family NAD(P)-dependent oxidoreductase [Bacteroidetes bacterium]|nr:SDR family NAD(P)-dependent oxidoreductase [Bacteroidota bacterium]
MSIDASSIDATKPVALVTGASSGIGAACAHALAARGYRVVLCGRNADRLEQLQREMQQAGFPESHVLRFDVRNRQAVEASLAALPPEWLPVSVLVNSAGNAHGMGPLHENDPDDWDAMMDGNVKGLLYVSKALVGGMIAAGRGHVVNISSVAGKSTYAGGVVYCASKQAVEAISEGMRLEWTALGIKVTNIAPGAVLTGFSQVRFKGDEARAAAVYDGFDPLLAQDIADAVVYAVTAPSRVTIADITLLAGAQAAATQIHRKIDQKK